MARARNCNLAFFLFLHASNINVVELIPSKCTRYVNAHRLRVIPISIAWNRSNRKDIGNTLLYVNIQHFIFSPWESMNMHEARGGSRVEESLNAGVLAFAFTQVRNSPLRGIRRVFHEGREARVLLILRGTVDTPRPHPAKVAIQHRRTKHRRCSFYATNRMRKRVEGREGGKVERLQRSRLQFFHGEK